MQFEKLFRLLVRNDVKELALQADRPPCALVGSDYTPVVSRNFSEDEVIAALVEAGGRAQVLVLVETPRRWEFEHPGVGTIRVSAGYHEGLLQARFRLIAKATNASPEPAPQARAVTTPLSKEPRTPSPFEAELPIPDVSQIAALGSALESVELSKPSEDPLTKPLTGSPEQVFDQLLELAREQGASDVHVLAARAPTLRIGGDLVPVGQPLDEELVERMLSARVPAAVQQDLAQHGSCDFAFTHPTLGRFRANVTRQRTGMKLTARPIQEKVPTLAELGLPESIANATHHHQGLIVVTGPTGHGKTTTLAAIVDIVNRERTDHIITVEDPIEYVHPRKRSMISQREVGTHTKSFAAALKGSLREDPDVIVVGELRDTETVRMALSASETGHLVIGTMNTPNAAKTIERLIDLFPPGDQPQVRMTLAGGLRLIVSQRLVPSADRRSRAGGGRAAAGLTSPVGADPRQQDLPDPELAAARQVARHRAARRLAGRTGARGCHHAGDRARVCGGTRAAGGAGDRQAARPLEPLQPSFNAGDASRDAAAAAQKLGKDMFAKAGKLFGDEK